MKNIKSILIILLFFTFGCGEKFLDINDDPYAILEGNLAQQLTYAELSIASTFGYGGSGINTLMSTVMHHTVSPRADKYDISSDQYAITTGWGSFYANAIMDIEEIIDMAEEGDNKIYAGIAKILKAYSYSTMVDIYGDIPYSQASDFLSYSAPAFDDDKAIYQSIFILIDEGIANLNTNAENKKIPSDDDVFYNGDPLKWITFANSLKLKLYNQVRLVDDMYDEQAVNELISGNIFLTSDDDFQCPYYNIDDPVAKNPGFTTEYDARYIEYNISPWIYELMMGYNPNLFTDLVDPRIPYYWFNPLGGGGEPVNTPEYWDGDFVSVIFGSNGPNNNADLNAESTVLGIYPIGGSFDNGEGGVVGPTDDVYGTGAAPLRLLTFFDILYIKAELALVGKTSENANELFEAALRASFEKVDEVVEGTGTQGIGSIWTSPGVEYTSANDYIDAVVTEFTTTENNERKMEILMTQKWIAHFGSGAIECYNDYRRTGYPVLYDPNTMVLQAGPEGHADYTSCSRNFPYSFPWSAEEIVNNQNAPDQKLPGIEAAKLFWDID